jgi:LacI family transcriptional regulator
MGRVVDAIMPVEAGGMNTLIPLAVATELGLRVPDDLALIGFDNIPESALCSPPLTTVQQPIRQMGHRAVEILIQLVRGEPVETTHVTLPTRLVERRSAAVLPTTERNGAL